MGAMILLTKLNNKEYMLNCDHIESLESTPDTVITLSNGKLLIARESPEEIRNRIIEYKRRIYSGELDIVKTDKLEGIEYIDE